jgi:hypothetical protein
MPGGLSGVQLARQACEVRPALKILLTSGYVGDLRTNLPEEFPLIEKPYERADLAARLRDLCDRPAAAAAASDPAPTERQA